MSFNQARAVINRAGSFSLQEKRALKRSYTEMESQAALPAEHGAGAIGTSDFGAPRTYRWTDKGLITTRIEFDISGLGVKGTTENDAIGLAAGGNAYIGRYVVATYGTVYKVQLSCIEAPGEGTSTITQDIDINVHPTIGVAYDGAAGSTKLFNTATLVVTETLTNDLPGTTLAADDYIFIVEGDTAATTGVYNAGQFVLTFYGQALLA